MQKLVSHLTSISFVLIAGSLGCGGGGDSPAAPPQTFQWPLAVTQLVPSWGPLSGGTVVLVSGTGFQPGVSVTFDGIAATDVRVINSTTMTATAPAHTAGLADVVVTNPAGQRSALKYSYTDTPFDPCYGCWDYQRLPSHP